MIVLDADTVASLLDWPVLIEALRHGHRQGIDLAERLLLSEPRNPPTPPNHLLIWPAWRFGDYCGAKLVTAFPGAAATTNSTIYVLFDGRDGRPLAVIEGAEFTLRKTAADSALGASYLAREDARILLMIGAGAQALAQIQAMRAVRPSIERVRIWNRTPAKARALAAILVKGGVDAAATEDLARAARDADIVCAATAAIDPVLRGAWLSPGTHVDLVGSFTPSMREADDETVRRAGLFVDSRRFTIDVAGDLAIPIAAGIITAGDVRADLFDLCAGRHAGRLSPEEITLFKNGGGGHLDLMAAICAYEGAAGARSAG